MAETTNIAKIAEKVSKELFSEFLWERSGPANANWPCELPEQHSSKTHPSDVVFFYDEPYSSVRTYVNCDLKSYAKGSIKGNAVKSAVESLARAHACAEISADWREKYIHNHVSAEICSLLFIYNHDGEYDGQFELLLKSVEHEKLQLPPRSKLFVLGPREIYWLNNIRYEIVQMRGTGKLPSRENCRYFYPHLVRRKNVQLDNARAATLEMLTSPWVVLGYTLPDAKKGFAIFYRRHGESVQEFLYLIDYLLHYQVLVDSTELVIKILDPHKNAHAFFAKAVDQYIDELGGGEEIKQRLKAIEFQSINQVQAKFSEIEIGMEP